MTSTIVKKQMKKKSSAKTEAVLLLGKQRPDENIISTVEDVQLRLKEVVKYLEVKIDQRMFFTSHLED